jgi:murein DD-endopeptidase MepM/ murein hydrolase activator NlpD/urea transporter/cytochrome c-type biogenesis protein CcmH/NrfG
MLGGLTRPQVKTLRNQPLEWASRRYRALLSAYAALLFARGTLVGWLLLGASCFDLSSGALGLSALLGAGIVVSLLGYRRDLADQGYFGTNALLCGLAVGHGHPLSLHLLLLASVAGVIAALLTAALSEYFDRVLRLPILALPFVITTTLLLPALGNYRIFSTGIVIAAIPDLPIHLPGQLAFIVKTFGAIVFQPSTAAGILVLTAVCVSSRIATAFGVWGVCVAALVSHYAAPHASLTFAQAAGYNGLLTSLAIGAVFFVPSVASLLWATVGSLVASWLALSLAGSFAHLSTYVLAWPFVITTMTLLYALGLRAAHRSPVLPPLPGENAERNLQFTRMLKTRFGLPGPIRVFSPVLGVWTVTQGFDGAHTHQGALRHALDFEITDLEGFPFGNGGTHCEDYHCFDAPVHAVLPGTVVFAYADHEDMPPGGQNLAFPWGNVVVIQHGPSLFSVLAHLRQGSLLVQAGQQVTSGQCVARCGSSGRSPRPHLHLQMQASAEIGSATIAFELLHYSVSRENASQYVPWGVPREGERLSASQPLLTPELDILRVGTDCDIECGSSRPHRLRSELSPVGERSIQDLETGERLYFSSLDGVATFTTYHGVRRSVLGVLGLALPRVPPFGGTTVLIEKLPTEWLLSTWGRCVNDVAQALGLGASLHCRVEVTRSQSALRSESTIELRWLGRVWRRAVAAVRIAEGQILSLGLVENHRIVLTAVPSTKTPASIRTRRPEAIRLRLKSVLAYLSIPAVAVVAGQSLMFTASTSTARPVPDPLAESYRLESSQDLEAAAAAAARAVRKSPRQYFPLIRLAYLESASKKYSLAAEHYAQAAKLAPNSVEPLLGQVQAAVASGQYDAACTVADALIQIDPKNYLALSRRAWSEYQSGKYGKAVSDYAAVLELYPGDIEMRLGHAYALSGAKRPVEAALEFQHVLLRVPGEPRARRALGLP